MTDSLNRLVDQRDRRFNTDRELYLSQRHPRTRRVCRFCWRMVDDDPKSPAITCPDCGHGLHEVTV